MIVTREAMAAYHEAGHAILALALGRDVQALALDSVATGGSLCAHSEGASARDELVILAAGRVGEGFARPLEVEPVPSPASENGRTDDPYFTPLEEALYAASTTPDEEGRVPSLPSDEEAQAALAAELADPEAELELAVELAWRTLAIRRDELDRLAEALLTWRSLDGGAIATILDRKD